MHVSPARWTAAVAAAALIALPGSALAQSNPTQNPPSQPPAQAQQPPAQPPAAAPAAPQAANSAKQHLTEARESLSQLTSMPEAAKLQGDARTKVSELISNFNALIGAQNDWRSSYAKVTESLTSLLGPDTRAASAPGHRRDGRNDGSRRHSTRSWIRGKLVEFRRILRLREGRGRLDGGSGEFPEGSRGCAEGSGKFPEGSGS